MPHRSWPITSALAAAGALGVSPGTTPGHIQVLGLGLCGLSQGFGVRLSLWCLSQVRTLSGSAADAAGMCSGHRGRVGSLVLRPASLFPSQLFSLPLSSPPLNLPPQELSALLGLCMKALVAGHELPRRVLVPCMRLAGTVGSSREHGGMGGCGASATSPPIIPKPARAPPGGESSLKEGLKMSSGGTSDRGALEALLFQRVGVRDPLRHERLRSSVPKVTARRRRRTGGCVAARGGHPGNDWHRDPRSLPPLPASKLGHT